MATITLREQEGRPLSFAEVDSNFSNLNDDKQETAPNLNVVTTIDVSSDKLSFYNTADAATRTILPQNILPFVERTVVIKCVADAIAPVTGNGITHFTIRDML